MNGFNVSLFGHREIDNLRLLKNQWMIEQSDLVIVYIERKEGGAYTAMKYAEKLNKKVINLYIKEI